MPLAKGLFGFARGQGTLYPRGPSIAVGYDVPSYALFNLFLGVRNPKDSWEVSVFDKNLFNRDVELYKSSSPIQESGGLSAIFGSLGYYNLSVTPPMQLGLNLRYAIGSR
jgi:iron complex outermembrane receptor protein